MKNYFIIMCGAVLLTGCSKSKDTGNTPVPGDLSAREVKMNTAIIGHRAACESDPSNLPLSATDVWFLRTADAPVGSVDWTSVGTSAQSSAGYSAGYFGATIGTDGSVVFKDAACTVEVKQYYSDNVSNYAHFMGLYPGSGATLTNSTGNTVATWIIDGKTDVMISNYVNGNKSSASPVTPQFKHLLTWLEFQVKAVDATASTIWGDVQSVTIEGANSSVTVEFEGDNTQTNYAGTGNLTTVSATDGTPASKTLTTASQSFSHALVNPATGYNVTVVTANGTATGIPVTFSDGSSATAALAGSKHLVTLNFSSAEVTATATVLKWADGDEGSATIN